MTLEVGTKLLSQLKINILYSPIFNFHFISVWVVCK